MADVPEKQGTHPFDPVGKKRPQDVFPFRMPDELVLRLERYVIRMREWNSPLAVADRSKALKHLLDQILQVQETLAHDDPYQEPPTTKDLLYLLSLGRKLRALGVTEIAKVQQKYDRWSEKRAAKSD